MKIVIDISKDKYDEIMSMDWKNCRLIFGEELRAIHDGKVLEQEPCEDAISRQAVDDAIYDYSRSCDVNYQQIMEFIEKIPLVTPQPKVGQWIDGKCNRCGTHAPYWAMSSGYYCSDYCPKCGAKMSEIPTGSESEG